MVEHYVAMLLVVVNLADGSGIDDYRSREGENAS